ncbi:hypothetical protein AYO45_00300 [Gammaproteobacteria bacterium SCGC AG-212-F23]|nr:hypothetical protein AYO45_00300 [Gammaproteobacteria bacterium SCGC AG-212-F23]
MRAPLVTVIPDDRHYDYYFCLFELIYNLVLIDYRLEKEDSHHHVFCSLSFQALNSHNKVIDDLTQEVSRLKDKHPLLLSGLFDGKAENLIKALGTIKEVSKSYQFL